MHYHRRQHKLTSSKHYVLWGILDRSACVVSNRVGDPLQQRGGVLMK